MSGNEPDYKKLKPDVVEATFKKIRDRFNCTDVDWNTICGEVTAFIELTDLTIKDDNAERIIINLVKREHELIKKKHELIETVEKLERKEDELIETKHELIETKHELIETKHELIETVEKLERKEDEIVEKDLKLKQHREQSIFGLLEKKSNFFKVELRYGSDSSHLETSHKAAAFIQKEFKLKTVPRGVVRWKEVDSKLKEKPSSLIGISKNGNLPYANEAQLHTYVANAVADALFVCNTLLEVACIHAKLPKQVVELCQREEYGIFSSNKPDHTVIFDSINGIDIVAIEDKKPHTNLKEKNKVNNVYGQVFDYLSMSASFGHPNPFGILTTLEDTWVCWLTGDKIVNDENSFDLDEMVNLVKGLPDRRETTATTPSSTPPKLRPEAASFSPNEITEELVEEKRIINISKKKYETHQLVTAICNAIFCGLRNFHWKPTRTTYNVDDCLKGVFVQFTKNDYTWVKGSLPPYTGKPAVQPRKFGKQQQFYVIELAGVGDTSRAMRALTKNGDECVIKMYIRKFVDNELLKKNQFNKNAKKSVEREVAMYRKIYPELRKNVWWQIVNNFYCVIVPYFKSVDRTEGTLNRIKKVLNEKFKHHNLRFSDNDIRWRHVGEFDDQIYLYDLADVKECKGNFDTYVEEHKTTLRRRSSKCHSPVRPTDERTGSQNDAA